MEAKQTLSVATSGLRVSFQWNFQVFLKQEGLNFPHPQAGLAWPVGTGGQENEERCHFPL